MTGAELSAALATLNWHGADLAARLRVRHQLVRRWASGRVEVPANVGVWLQRLVDDPDHAPELPDGWQLKP